MFAHCIIPGPDVGIVHISLVIRRHAQIEVQSCIFAVTDVFVFGELPEALILAGMELEQKTALGKTILKELIVAGGLKEGDAGIGLFDGDRILPSMGMLNMMSGKS